MQRTFRTVSIAACFGLGLPLLTGCGLILGKAASTALSSTTDVQVTPSQIALNIGQQQLFQARASQVLGNDKSVSPSWQLLGDVGYIDQNGLFTATNPGKGEVRGTVSTAAGAAHVVGKASVIVGPPAAAAPQVTAAAVSPASGGTGTLLTFTAKVAGPAGAKEIQRVVASDLATSLTVNLFDDGVHGGDKVANDGLYTGQLTLPAAITASSLRFGIHAEDFSSPPNSSAWSWTTFTLGSSPPT